MHLNDVPKRKRSLGALRKADKTKPKSPGLTGQLRLQRHTAEWIAQEFNQENADEVVCNLAGWKNTDHSGSYLTVELSPRFVARTPTERDDILDAIINDSKDDELETI